MAYSLFTALFVLATSRVARSQLRVFRSAPTRCHRQCHSQFHRTRHIQPRSAGITASHMKVKGILFVSVATFAGILVNSSADTPTSEEGGPPASSSEEVLFPPLINDAGDQPGFRYCWAVSDAWMNEFRKLCALAKDNFAYLEDDCHRKTCYGNGVCKSVGRDDVINGANENCVKHNNFGQDISGCCTSHCQNH